MPWNLFRGFRLGSGLIGKTTYTVMSLCVVCLAGVIYLPELWKLAPLGCAFVVVLLHGHKSFQFAEKQPILATMDGLDAVSYLQAQISASDPKLIEASRTQSAPVAAPAELTTAPLGDRNE